MKVNELRIGNYVSDIHAVDTFCAAVKKLDFSRCYYGQFNSDYSYLKPIPLTREWLIKFKFEELEKDCRTFFKKGKFKVELSNGGNVYYNRNIFISSVHQLQNLYFALIGEELTFKSE